MFRNYHQTSFKFLLSIKKPTIIKAISHTMAQISILKPLMVKKIWLNNSISLKTISWSKIILELLHTTYPSKPWQNYSGPLLTEDIMWYCWTGYVTSNLQYWRTFDQYWCSVNHQMTGKQIDMFCWVIEPYKGLVLAMWHNYSNIPNKAQSIHSKLQLQAHGTLINNTVIAFCGLQRI